ncbi:hypothetical protein ATE68_23430 [Sphingopyxis sp. H038]|nr:MULTISPECIES: hypothetical protein [unclassified Sphingopyxis]KTD99396.1 hypothetical protein ATE78_23375 [Sphingopyxis sp. H012]KTE01014.1 hypothetical protein ATE76_24690 [Sphingopyxis sp. H093]KTE29515.1 hypothetical protein ATE68_23430 [Sphingopyxis sp. H038]KTE58624.1 hypothetical protein ATE74_24095 [Sphingopyxis sp. H085]KTE17195.1 hypothetical protein ATE75_24015 [Sphingopyxis sp. H080]
MVVVARLRAAPLVGWQFACAVLLGVLLVRLDWGGDPLDAFRNMVFGQPLLLLGIAAVLGVWGYILGMWRRRGDYLRHDGVTLYRGGSARWPLALVRDVVVARGNIGLESLRLVVDDDSEVTRELVKLYMLEGPPEAVRDGVMFAVARVGGVMRPVTVH